MNARFANRRDAGMQLARRLTPLSGRSDVIVLGIGSEGLEVAEVLGRRLDLAVQPFESWSADLRQRTVVIVADAAPTAHTLVAAARSLRQLGPDEVIVAVPMLSAVAATHIAACADRCVTVWIAPDSCSPDQGYLEFPTLARAMAGQCCARTA